jgi:hypothetical protein
LKEIIIFEKILVFNKNHDIYKKNLLFKKFPPQGV